MNLYLNNLSKTYSNGVKALINVSMNISNGMFGLLGPNGAGKIYSNADNCYFTRARYW